MLKKFSHLFMRLQNPKCLEMLDALSEKPFSITTGEIAERLGVTFVYVSRCLTDMERAGLVIKKER